MTDQSALAPSTESGRDTLPPRCGVVGGGRMGAGIAHALLLAGCEVALVERDASAAAAAGERVERAVRGSVQRGLLDDPAAALTLLRTTTAYADLADAGLVVEAVPEDTDLKLATLRAIEDVVATETVLASNTSSISLSTLAQALARPERMLGMHFFNPVPASKLVEVVLTDATAVSLRERVGAWVARLGKTAVVIRDSPGFASSRLGVVLGLEAIRMVEAQVASAEDVDAAMRLGYGHPMGPLRLTDIVGLDVRLGIARYLERELGDRFAPPRLLVDLVERGRLGRKSGRGFYDWSAEES